MMASRQSRARRVSITKRRCVALNTCLAIPTAFAAMLGFAPPSPGSPGTSSPPAAKPATPPANPPANGAPPAVTPRLFDPRAIDRYDPKVYDVRFEVVMSGFPATDRDRAINLTNTPFVLPLIMRGPFSKVDPTSLQPQAYLDSKLDRDLPNRARLEENQELGMTFAVLPINFSGTAIRWNVSWRAQVWSSRVDESVLVQKTWPREWPEEVRSALEPQKGIESDLPFAKKIVESAVGDRLRSMPPWHAAKEIIRTVTIGFKSVSSDAWERRAMGRIIGLKMCGAQRAVADGFGTTHDLVATCVAALRAAGLPARPVVAFYEDNRTRSGGPKRQQTLLTSWAEVYIPDAGWVPFDPDELRGNAVRQLKVENAWPGVGNLKDLNDRVPIAWCFAPKAYDGSDFASVWGWKPQGTLASTRLEAVIQLQVTSRGKGVDDPE